MKIGRLAAALMGAAWLASAASNPPVSRAEVQAVEKAFDQRVERLDATDPMDLLGSTRGVYLEGYGIVFTSEVNLIVVPPIGPFRREVTKGEIEKFHQRKVARLPRLRELMRTTLVEAASSLNGLQGNEKIALGVCLFYFSWEARDGLPGQILMQAPRQTLLGFKNGSVSAAQLEAAILTREY